MKHKTLLGFSYNLTNKMTAKLTVAACRELILCALRLMLLPSLLLSDNVILGGMNIETRRAMSVMTTR